MTNTATLCKLSNNGSLRPDLAQSALADGAAWDQVARYVTEPNWWLTQKPRQAPTPTSDWQITAWDATLKVEVDGCTAVIDPGEKCPDHFESAPDLFVLTHAHLDHYGKLGALSSQYPDAPVVMTAGTSNLLALRAVHDVELAECLARRTVRLGYGDTCRLGGFEITLFPAGHLLGAAMADLTRNCEAILVTGDFALREVGGLPGAQIPSKSYAAVAIESTQACRTSLPSADPLANGKPMCDAVDKALAEGANSILVRAQAYGQAQELYTRLIAAQQSGSFPQLQIRLAGLAADVGQIYHATLSQTSSPWYLPALSVIGPDMPHNSLAIVGDDNSAGNLAGQLSSSLRRTPGGTILPNLPAWTHASWAERMTLGIGVACAAIITHQGANPSINALLAECGRKVVSLASAGDKWRN